MDCGEEVLIRGRGGLWVMGDGWVVVWEFFRFSARYTHTHTHILSLSHTHIFQMRLILEIPLFVDHSCFPQ